MKRVLTALAFVSLGLVLIAGCTSSYSVVGAGIINPGVVCDSQSFSQLTCPDRGLWSATGTMNITGSTVLVDAYASSVGAYGGSNQFPLGNVQAGGALNITGSGVIITGSQTANNPSNLKIVNPNSSSLGNLNITGPGSFMALAPGDYYYDSINITGSNIGITAGSGQVRIWYNSLNITGPNANIGSSKPNDLWFLGTCQATTNITGSGGTYRAIIYSPSGDVNITGSNLDFDGSIVGNTLSITGPNDSFHRDISVCGH